MDATLTADVAAAVRAEAARAGVSLATLAGRLGWGRGYMQRRSSGQVAFRVDELTAIAEVLGVPLATFLPTSNGGAAA